jgi:hypothetical protein
MLSVQEASQEPHTLIATLQNQVSLQHQLLAAQATLTRQDKLLARAWTTPPQGDGMTLALLTAPPAVAQAQMTIGGTQPECLLLQYRIQSCARGGRRIVEDMCYEIQRAEACVD